MRLKKFTLIELIVVTVILGIMVTGSVAIVANLVNGAVSIEQVSQYDLDQNYTLLRLRKELSVYRPSVTVNSPTSFTMERSASGISNVSWNPTEGQLLYDGTPAIDNVTLFQVSQSNGILNLQLGMTGSEAVTTSILLRE